jgi:hypothetical protein
MSLNKKVTTPSGSPLTRHPHREPSPAPATSPAPRPPRPPPAHPTLPCAPPPRTHRGHRRPGPHRHLDPPLTLPGSSVIALWLGHEDAETTQVYLHADMTIKEQALARVQPPHTSPGRYRPPDTMLAFLDNL